MNHRSAPLTGGLAGRGSLDGEPDDPDRRRDLRPTGASGGHDRL
ncbi:MAG TPA: hypothetical protein VLA76_11315 [Candidatus Angelobacter sp.]|nr:hypothetical protein [Candidatus Angelobacter sp.]